MLNQMERRLAELEARLEVQPAAPSTPTLTGIDARAMAANAAASRMKVTMEHVADQLLAEQARNGELQGENAVLEARLRTAESRYSTLDGLSRALGDSLTQLLGPDHP